MIDILLIAVKYSLVSNVVLSQFLGICSFVGVSKKSSASKGMGGAVIFVTVLASIVSHLIYVGLMSASSPLCKALGITDGLDFLNTIVFILVIAALVQLVEMFMKKNMKSLYDALGVYLPLITTNCAVLGVALNNVTYGYNMIECIVYGLGIGLGYALAILLLSYIRENVTEDNKDIPRSFQGAPIVLLTSCLMSIAFFGFQGLI
ncbi:MAG TPA: electron transport complex subunit RsxA [Oribacterium sp.]|nr:electron transport complex subunit RsxA [Oribacterium sp.]